MEVGSGVGPGERGWGTVPLLWLYVLVSSFLLLKSFISKSRLGHIFLLLPTCNMSTMFIFRFRIKKSTFHFLPWVDVALIMGTTASPWQMVIQCI